MKGGKVISELPPLSFYTLFMKTTWEQISAVQQALKREQGTIIKDWGGKLAIALAYPNQYRVAMASLGFQSVYSLFNRQADVVCERIFYEGPGLSPHQSAVISFESQRSLEEFSVIAFSLSFEMDYFNVIDLLRSEGIPLSNTKRDETFPLLIAGGPAITANPLPLSTVLDAVIIGEAEKLIPQLTQTLIETLPTSKEVCLTALAGIPGVYVPLFHGPTDDTQHIHPVERQWIPNLDDYPTHSVVLSPDTEFGDMYLIEIARGCIRNCPFCLAGHTYKPHRERTLERVLAQAREGLRHRQRIGLISAAVSDYSKIDELAVSLKENGARLSVSSLRVRPLSETLVRILAESGDQTLTIAPEAGSQRLRGLIQKGVREEDLFHAADLAQKYNFHQLKLYFMVGLPTETDEDITAIVQLVRELGQHFARQIIVNITPFVPKAQTPLERAAMFSLPEIEGRLNLLRRELLSRGVSIKHDSPRAAVVQAILARGDRDVSLTLEQLRQPTIKGWEAAARAKGLSPERYLQKRELEENLPWQNILVSSNSQLKTVKGQAGVDEPNAAISSLCQ